MVIFIYNQMLDYSSWCFTSLRQLTITPLVTTDKPNKFSTAIAAKITLSFAVFVASFSPTLLALHERWSSWTASYSHGYLLLATAVYLYFESDRVAPRWLPDIRNVAPVFLALFSLSWLIFHLAGIGVLQQIALPAILLALLGSLVDADRFWRAILPVAMIYLAIPLWDDLLIPPLQLLSTEVSGWVVAHVFGIPASIHGFDISIPAGMIKIETGCSGLVFFLSALTLGIVYGQLFLGRWLGRIGAVLIAGILGILVNWIRIASLIIIGQTTNMESSLLTQGHLLYGWYLFSGTMLISVLAASRLLPPRPQQISMPRPSDPLTIPAGRLAATLLALAIGPLLLLGVRIQSSDHPIAQPPPEHFGALLIRTQTELTGFIKPAVDVTYRYLPNPDLTVSVVFYGTFFGRGKLVDQVNRVWPDNAEIIEQTQRQERELPRILATRFKVGNQVKLAWSWYSFSDTTADTLGQAKVAQLVQTLKGQFGGAYIHFETPCQLTDCAIEQEKLARDVPGIYRNIHPFLEKLIHSR